MVPCPKGGWVGKSISEFSRPLFSKLMITWRESCEGFPLKGIFSLFAAGTQGCFHLVKRNAGAESPLLAHLGFLKSVAISENYSVRCLQKDHILSISIWCLSLYWF